ncbi:5-methylcytosine-specific restriction endonuclease system specificity protein McrC [Gimesia maris]|uniref:5-methylcytosine-specific restriction enzyme subunit McrC n=1 Tax=Gimesia maris TaxID=122 RepID=A0ABX5YNU2_9PLAN|nr:5-methylcytosine-specific restriction endonuclease system specificity protein McrC [Gimesia maris]EDL62302.1 McrC protein [Gimesia maris DSM 8797]QEG17300.1 5-methylcytosine-specific restriction enzyme subunit McrC [Gimesia maris]QGQ29603.1 5-methylcytosine-specific restriction endonuclease system specificity protein McrC [Gimesia maris]
MTIPIQNIYYLLCYAWDKLQEGQIVSVSPEDCQTTAELFARVLDSGVTHLLKRGLDRNYISEEIETSSLRGKFDITTTIKQNLLRKSRVHCVVDSFSYDVPHNRIIKATLRNLLRCRELDRDQRDRLLRLYRRLHDVSDIKLTPKDFNNVQLHRNNAWYGFLLQVCRLIYDNLLINEETGDSQFRDFLRDERQMARLFENFVFNFYRKEQSVFKVKSELLTWQGVDATPEDQQFLPRMRTDVSLDSSTRKIVLDAKYYKDSLQSFHGNSSVHSENLYQLFAYLKNFYLKNIQNGDSRPIEGILLYPTTGQSLSLNYEIHGHSIRIVTLNLNTSWKEIRQQLLNILEPNPLSLTLPVLENPEH